MKNIELDKIKIQYPEYSGKHSYSFKDETNNQYGQLKVLYQYIDNKTGVKWVCQCDCGKIRIAKGTQLRSKAVSACEECAKQNNINLHKKIPKRRRKNQ